MCQHVLQQSVLLQVARNYTALTLMLANASLGAVTQYDVITVAAMEGVGVAAAMQQQQATSGLHQALPICLNSTWWSSPLVAVVMHFTPALEKSWYLSTLGVAHCLTLSSLRTQSNPMCLLWLL